MKDQKTSGGSSKEKICPYALSGYPQRITFIRKKEEPIEDIFSINYITCSLDYVDIYLKGKCKAAQRNVTLNYMKQRLPPCLFFYCGKGVLVNMSRVKSWCWTGRRIKLVLIRNKELYVSRLRTLFFLALSTLYPGILGK
jgi:DNA-binding LytR/AlgR family response regulator